MANLTDRQNFVAALEFERAQTRIVAKMFDDMKARNESLLLTVKAIIAEARALSPTLNPGKPAYEHEGIQAFVSVAARLNACIEKGEGP